MEIYVYGTGCGAGELIDTALDARRVTAFVDPAAKGSFLGRPVIAPQELAGRPLDLLIVAGRQAEAIARELAELGIDENRVLYLKNHLIPAERNRNYALAERVLGKAYVERLRNSERLIRAPLWTQQERIAGPEADNDYVRLKTLEALCLRLDGVPGAVAELGVYRGGFSRWLNLLLPERTLLLFDTFEGFDPTEAQGQGDGFVEAHRNSSVELRPRFSGRGPGGEHVCRAVLLPAAHERGRLSAAPRLQSSPAPRRQTRGRTLGGRTRAPCGRSAVRCERNAGHFCLII